MALKKSDNPSETRNQQSLFRICLEMRIHLTLVEKPLDPHSEFQRHIDEARRYMEALEGLRPIVESAKSENTRKP